MRIAYYFKDNGKKIKGKNLDKKIGFYRHLLEVPGSY
jgi:hypothetical protein